MRHLTKRLLALSDRAYRLLLLAYPAPFRRAYGRHMAQVFHDCCRETYQRGGPRELARLWLRTLADLVVTAFRERVSESDSTNTATPIHALLRAGEGRGTVRRFFRRSDCERRESGALTRRANRVIKLAADEARIFQHAAIGPEHILLGIMRESEGVGALVLQDLGITLDQVHRSVQQSAGAGGDQESEWPKLSQRAAKTLEHAAEEARLLNHNFVGTEHLLLSLTYAGEGGAAETLDRIGVRSDQVRGQVLQVLASNRMRC